MKKLKKLFLLLLIIPFTFSIAACKDKSGDDDGGTPSPSNPNENVTLETFSIAYDYNLPEKYDFLLTDYTHSNNAVGTSVDLVGIADENLAKYFLGWYNDEDEKVEGSVTSSSASTINLKAKWNEDSINKYYYTPGLVFDVENGEASILEFSSSALNVVIPKVYTIENVDYPVTIIGESVFAGKNTQKLVVNAQVLKIGNNAFKNSNLINFDLSIVVEIGNNAFESTNLSEVTLSPSLTSLGEAAFKGCKNLTKVNFSNLEIDVFAETFKACENLSLIENAKNIKTIGNEAFYACASLTSNDFLNECSKLTTLGNNAFANCINIESAIIPESVLEIELPFEGCLKLSNLTLSRNYDDLVDATDSLLNHIGNVGSSLKNISYVGNSVSKIIEYYFDGLTELETFVMCDSIVYVEDYAFRQCTKLKTITLSNNIDLESFSYLAFKNTKYLNDMVEPLIYKHTIIYVPKNIVAEYSIPSGVTKINSFAFADADTLQKITIPSTIEIIDSGAFKDCDNLVDVIFESNNKIEKIGDSAFDSCDKLNNVNLSALTALTEIGIESFKDTNFSKFIIPSTVNVINIGAFSGVNLTEFEVFGTGGIFVSIDGVLYKDITESASPTELMLVSYPRMKEGSLFVCPENVSKIASYAFAEASNLRYVYFGQSQIEWETSRDGHGEYVYTSFYNTAEPIKILRESTALSTSEARVVHYDMISTGFDWDFEDQEIKFEEGFTTSSTYCFKKVLDNDKFSIVLFELEIVEGQATVVDGTLIFLEKVLSE